MPVMCVYPSLDLGSEFYDEVRALVGWEKDPPKGAISHAIAFRDGGAYEVNVWESRAAYEAYRDNRLRPVLDRFSKDIGEPEIMDLHMFAVGAPAQSYSVPRAVMPALANA